jgi:hypothetical protein
MMTTPGIFKFIIYLSSDLIYSKYIDNYIELKIKYFLHLRFVIFRNTYTKF